MHQDSETSPETVWVTLMSGPCACTSHHVTKQVKYETKMHLSVHTETKFSVF